MDYRWGRGPKGQYIDGHEREDVVAYRQEIFLPTLANHEDRIRTYDRDGNTIPYSGPRPMTRRLVIWFHDESTFYANDRRRVFWVHKDEKAVPEPKGEGPSLMVADFISADYGWLGSPDGDGVLKNEREVEIMNEDYLIVGAMLSRSATGAMDVPSVVRADVEDGRETQNPKDLSAMAKDVLTKTGLKVIQILNSRS